MELEIDEGTSTQKVAELIQVLGFAPSNTTAITDSGAIPIERPRVGTETFGSEVIKDLSSLSKIDLVKLLFRSISQYDDQWYSAKDILELYRRYIDSDVPQSTISTYLSRLHKESLLRRRGSRRNLEYSLAPEKRSSIPHYQFINNGESSYAQIVKN